MPEARFPAVRAALIDSRARRCCAMGTSSHRVAAVSADGTVDDNSRLPCRAEARHLDPRIQFQPDLHEGGHRFRHRGLSPDRPLSRGKPAGVREVAQDRLRNNGLQVLVCEPVPQVVGLVGCAERQLSAARRPGPTTRRRGRETPSRSAPPTGPGRVGGCHSTSNRLDAPHAGVGRSFTCVRDSRSGARNHPYERIHVLPLMILGNAGMLIVRQTLS